MLKRIPFLDGGLNYCDDDIARTSAFGEVPVCCCSEDLPEEYRKFPNPVDLGPTSRNGAEKRL